MQLLKRLDVSPPDQFHYVNPDTGWLNRQMAYDDWVKKEKEHRRANSLPIPDDLEAQMQDQLCKTIPPEWCTYQKDGTWVNLRIAFSDVVTVTRAILDLVTGNYVPQEEANRRADICSRCFYNTSVGGCGACHGLSNLVAGDRSTPFDSNLKSCAVCKCHLRAVVHIPLTSMRSHDIAERQMAYPDFCWSKIGGDNYRG